MRRQSFQRRMDLVQRAAETGEVPFTKVEPPAPVDDLAVEETPSTLSALSAEVQTYYKSPATETRHQIKKLNEKIRDVRNARSPPSPMTPRRATDTASSKEEQEQEAHQTEKVHGARDACAPPATARCEDEMPSPLQGNLHSTELAALQREVCELKSTVAQLQHELSAAHEAAAHAKRETLEATSKRLRWSKDISKLVRKQNAAPAAPAPSNALALVARPTLWWALQIALPMALPLALAGVLGARVVRHPRGVLVRVASAWRL